jgi:hypothetical protein
MQAMEKHDQAPPRVNMLAVGVGLYSSRWIVIR